MNTTNTLVSFHFLHDYNFANPDNQFTVLTKLILPFIDCHASLTRTTFTKYQALWMKDLDIIKFIN